MLTKAMTRFLCEKVLGWPWTTGEGPLGGWWWRADWGERIFHPPDFTTWEGFGMLLTAVNSSGRYTNIRNAGPWLGWSVDVGSNGHPHGHCYNPDPRVALALAAAKAYGWKEE